jgi:hypothetical protein
MLVGGQMGRNVEEPLEELIAYLEDQRQVGILHIMEQTMFSVLSNQEPVTMVTNAQHNFQRGLLSTMKKWT